jgi:hypothetical protein
MTFGSCSTGFECKLEEMSGVCAGVEGRDIEIFRGRIDRKVCDR